MSCRGPSARFARSGEALDSLLRFVASLTRFIDSIHWFDFLIPFVASIHWFDSLFRFLDTIHWFDFLVRFIDSIHWFDSLIRLIDSIHWVNFLSRCIDSLHWFDSLIRFVGSIHWFDSSIRFLDSTHWLRSRSAKPRFLPLQIVSSYKTSYKFWFWWKNPTNFQSCACTGPAVGPCARLRLQCVFLMFSSLTSMRTLIVVPPLLGN